MPDDYDERFRQHEDILRSLTAMLAAQHEFNRQQVEFNQQQRDFNADVRTTLARIEALIARMLPTSENGRDA